MAAAQEVLRLLEHNMATIGELLEQLRNGAMNAEATGDSPYSGIEPGTNSPVLQPGIDDIPEENRLKMSDYLSQRTKGIERLEEQNQFPIEPELQPIRFTDPATGNPSPLTSPSEPQQSFVRDAPADAAELAVRDGFLQLQKLGFFQDLQGEDGPEYDKNAQSTGHSLLNSNVVKEKVVGVLATNRFSALTTPNQPSAGL